MSVRAALAALHTKAYSMQLPSIIKSANKRVSLTYRTWSSLRASCFFQAQHMHPDNISSYNRISGPGATDFLTHLLPTSLKSLLATAEQETVFKGSKGVRGPYKSSLSLLLNREGGIIDDLVVTRHGDDRLAALLIRQVDQSLMKASQLLCCHECGKEKGRSRTYQSRA